MLGIVCGNLGSGKSLFLTILAIFSKKQVISNFTLNTNYEKFDITKFINAEYDNCMILLDEVYQYIDSRNSQMDMNRFFSYILFQSRKKSIDLYLAAQLVGTIDVRFRSLADCVVNCEKSNEGFVYTIFAPSNVNENFVSVLPYEKAEKFFKFYDTNEIIFDVKPNEQLKFMKPKEKMKKIKLIAKDIIAEFKKKDKGKKKKISRAFVSVYCMEKGLDSRIVSDIHNYLKVNYGN